MSINLNAGPNTTGYGCVATNILHQLELLGAEPCLFPIGEPDLETQELLLTYNKAFSRQSHYSSKNPGLRIWHQFSMAERYSSKLNAGLTFFELDTLKNNEINHLNSLDILFVASEWAKQVVDNHCSVDCRVVPMGVNTEIFRPQKDRPNGSYKFFTTGKTEYRKGHDVLLEAFESAFGPDCDVELHIKWHNPFLSQTDRDAWTRYYKQSSLANKIFFHETDNQIELAEMIRGCDCGVYPTRAEGFGLGLLEAIACDKHLISTDYSGHVDFCKMANADLVHISEKEKASDGIWFFGDGKWAKWNDQAKSDLIDKMRKAYKERIYGSPNREEVLKKYNWETTTKEICQHLEIDLPKFKEVNQGL